MLDTVFAEPYFFKRKCAKQMERERNHLERKQYEGIAVDKKFVLKRVSFCGSAGNVGVRSKRVWPDTYWCYRWIPIRCVADGVDPH